MLAANAIFTDTFTDAGELVAHTPDSNAGSGAWTTSAGSGRVLLANNDLQIRYDSGYSAAIDVGVSNQKLVVDVTAGGSTTRKPLIMINREAVTSSSAANDMNIEGASYAAQLASDGSSTVLASASLSMDANSTYTVVAKQDSQCDRYYYYGINPK